MTRFALDDPTVLDLGAGRVERHRGALRLDVARKAEPHVVADLDGGGIPFRSNSFRVVAAHDVVEHVADLPALMDEVHRVLRPGGRFLVTTPHFSCANAYTDPTHRRAFGLRSFDYFTAAHPLAYYCEARFQVRTAQLHFHESLLGRALRRLANRWPEYYEHRLAWLFPAWFLYFELEPVK